MIRGFLLRVGMVLGWILGCVNFMTDGSEDWRVRCGWMYYTEKRPEYGLKRLKIPPYISVKKSAIFYVRRILVHAGNNDYFPGYISVWIHSEKFPVKIQLQPFRHIPNNIIVLQ